MTGMSVEDQDKLQSYLDKVDEAKLSSFFVEEMGVVDSIPDGRDYYEYVLKHVQLDKSNPKNSYYMFINGKVDCIDLTSPCKFTGRATALPDIDVDFPTDYREKAIDYVRDKYGEDRVCQIVTFGRYSGRSALKAVMRAEGSIDAETANLITRDIPDEAAISDQLEAMEEPSVILWSLQHGKEDIKEFCRLEGDELVGDYADIFRKALRLEGTFQNIGKHAAGVIISSEKIEDVAPMVLGKDGSRLAAFDMGDLEKVGLVKFDFLGVDILNKIQTVAGTDILKVPLDDRETWETICSGNTKGVFQIENKLGRDWATELKPHNIEELSALIAILRPGVLASKAADGRSIAKLFCDRKNGEEIPDTPLNKVIDTYGLLIFQESLLNVCKQIAGFNSADSIVMMKCVSEDSLIYTKSGPKRIDSVESGEYILSVDNGKSYYSKIKNVWSTGKQEVYRVRSTNGFSIDATANHQILTDKGWLPVSDINESHFIMIPRNYTYDRYCAHSVERSIIIGYFISEGCYTEKSRNPKVTNKDKNVINLLKKCIESEFGDGSSYIYEFKNGVMDIRLNGRARKFIQDNFRKVKSAEKIIPQKFINLPQNHLRTIISCMTDGDGTVSEKHITLSSASLSLLRQVQAILLCDNIYSSIVQDYNKKYNKYYYDLNICTKRDISRFYNDYTEFLCKPKKDKILAIINSDYSEEMSTNKFRIPVDIVKSCFGIEKLNSIIGHFINSGQCYGSSLTVDKARYLNTLVGSSFMQEVLDSDFYYVQVKNISLVGEVNTFDYETEDSNHCGFINGVLVHNSVGKKDAKKLFSLEEKFLKGCAKTGILNTEDAKSLFDNIRHSSRYLFNLAHSVSYSFPAYWAAYLKTHKPLDFYKTWLEYSCNKLDPQEEVRALVMSARLDNIEILPPSCEYLTDGFFIKGEAIVYGLTHIKGVSQREITKLFELMKTHGVMSNVVCYLTEIFPNVNKRTINAMISTGCFAYLGVSRAKLAHLYECTSSLTEKELLFFTENRFDDIEIGLQAAAAVRKEGGACSTKARVPKILAILERIQNPGVDLFDLPAMIATSEENAIGIPLSCSYLDSILSAGISDSTCKEIKRGKPGKRTIVVKIKEVREHIIKKSEKKMCFLICGDDSAELDNVVCFADEYEQFSGVLYQGAVVALLGELSSKKSFVITRAVEI